MSHGLTYKRTAQNWLYLPLRSPLAPQPCSWLRHRARLVVSLRFCGRIWNDHTKSCCDNGHPFCSLFCFQFTKVHLTCATSPTGKSVSSLPKKEPLSDQKTIPSWVEMEYHQTTKGGLLRQGHWVLAKLDNHMSRLEDSQSSPQHYTNDISQNDYLNTVLLCLFYNRQEILRTPQRNSLPDHSY